MAYNLSKVRALVVEPNELMGDMLSNVLKSAGCGWVWIARDSDRALQIVKEFKPDVIITERSLKPMNGLDFVRYVRSDKFTPDPYVAVIMASTFDNKDQVFKARDAGVTECVAKPFSMDALVKILVHVIDKPRPFIKTVDFFGPDRRRKSSFDYVGPRRRASDDPKSKMMGLHNAVPRMKPAHATSESQAK